MDHKEEELTMDTNSSPDSTENHLPPPPSPQITPRYQENQEILQEVTLMTGDNSGNHSSEEELEEINTKKKEYLELEHVMDSSRDCKRKWSHSDTSTDSDTEFEEPELRLELCKGVSSTSQPEERSTSTSLSAGSSTCDTCDTPSGDEDQNTNNSSSGPEPVQFSTSPPSDVHKPRRSLSPPNFSFTHSPPHGTTGSHIPPRVSTGSHVSSTSNVSPCSKLGNFSNSLGDLSTIENYENVEKRVKKSISPRKKSRTSRVHHIQRPCLDFEKMQQRARAVSWRHGGELSLFCW